MDLENGTAYLLDGDEYVYTEMRGAGRIDDEDGALYPINGDGEPAFLVKGDRLVRPYSNLWVGDVSSLEPSH